MISNILGEPVIPNDRQRPKTAQNLIAFCGPAQVGKTTAATALLTAGFVKFSFADPIRVMLRAIGVPDSFLKVDKEVPIPLLGGKTARQAMQTLGTDWGRNMIHPDIWLNIARHELRYCTAPIVIDDVRFDNEAEVIHELGGIVVQLEKPGIRRNSSHASERGISPELISHTIFAADVPTLQTLALELIALT